MIGPQGSETSNIEGSPIRSNLSAYKLILCVRQIFRLADNRELLPLTFFLKNVTRTTAQCGTKINLLWAKFSS